MTLLLAYPESMAIRQARSTNILTVSTAKGSYCYWMSCKIRPTFITLVSTCVVVLFLLCQFHYFILNPYLKTQSPQEVSDSELIDRTTRTYIGFDLASGL